MSEELDNGQGITDPVVDEGAVVETPAAETDEAPGEGQEQPAEYTDFALPEGIAMDQEVLGEFVPLAKELGLSQDQAQRLVDMGSKLAGKMHEAGIENWRKQTNEWADHAKADQEIGGKEFEANMAHALKAIDTFGTDALKTLLNESGIGNHPEVVRFAYRIGKAIGDDRSLVVGKSKQQDALKAMYPTMNQ